jgi:uncharacterized protein (TIGR03435 family)
MLTSHRYIFHVFAAMARLLFCVACLFTVTLPASFGQTTTVSNAALQANQTRAYTPTFIFDIASIREAKPTAMHFVRIENPPHAGSFTGNNITVNSMISFAYGIDVHLISDKSEWADTVSFDVLAKSDDSVNDALAKMSDDDAKLEKRHMVQSLLFDRFKLSAHKESRVTPMFELRLANVGPKVREVKPGTMTSTEAEQCRDHDGHCGRQSCGPNGCDLTAVSYSIKFLCTILQAQIGSPVLDKTGLTGNYAFRLQYYAPKLYSEGDESTFTSVFDAVQEQLGMKLVRTSSPVEYVIVDHIEKPTPN